MADIGTIINGIFTEFLNLIKAPAIEPDIWWILIPVLAVLLLLSLYFGVYSREKLGWSSLMMNSVSLVFVGMNLLHRMFDYTEPGSIGNFLENPVISLLVVLIMVEGLLLTTIAFKRKLPAWLVRFIASPVSVNSQAYVVAAMVYVRQTPSIHTFIAAIFLYAALYLVFAGIRESFHFKKGVHNKKRK